VDQPTEFRVNPWIVLVIVAVLLVVAAVLLAPTAMHAANGFLHAPQQMAPVCTSLPGPC
jgi:hypothetical protein